MFSFFLKYSFACVNGEIKSFIQCGWTFNNYVDTSIGF